MTLILAALTSAVVLVVGTLIGMFEHVAMDKGRAQTAADAAALAAIAESAPAGAGLYDEVARRFAAANGATLTRCDGCVPGTTSIVVTVELDGIEARARATIDPSAFLPVATGFDAGGLDPRLADAVDHLIAAARGAIRVVSGWRSPRRQQELWSAALQKYGDAEIADDWVARPGSSMHERGLAVDLGGDLDLAASLVQEMDLPLFRPLPNEPWHFELVGSR